MGEPVAEVISSQFRVSWHAERVNRLQSDSTQRAKDACGRAGLQAGRRRPLTPLSALLFPYSSLAYRGEGLGVRGLHLRSAVLKPAVPGPNGVFQQPTELMDETNRKKKKEGKRTRLSALSP